MPDLNHEWTRGQLECLWTAAECCKYWPSCDDVTQSRCHEASHVTPSMDPIIRHNTARLTGGWLLVVCHFPIFPTLHKRTFLRIINNFIKHIRYKAALVRARRYSDGDRWWQCSSVCSILLMSKDFINWHKIGNLFALLNVDIFCCIIAPAITWVLSV